MKKVGVITHYYKSLNYGGNFEEYEKAVRESIAFLKDGLN